MPTYVYECKTCSNVFEVDQRITEAPLTDCPCGSAGSVKRVIQPPAIMFKGPGFYVTDSAKAAAPAKAPSSETPTTTDHATPPAAAPAAPEAKA